MKSTQTYRSVLITLLIAVFLLSSVSGASAATNLPVPFTSQAPDGHWVEPWANACEETSIVMVDAFYFGYSLKEMLPQYARNKILRLVKIENDHFGFNKDTNADQIAELINLFLPWEAEVVENPTIEQIKRQIDNGRPVIIPAHGRDLNNPHYRSEQVDYHVLVISGYDDDTREFITQEPATQHGLDFRYPYDTMMTAIHDFLPKDKTFKGRKVAVFTRKEIKTSGNTDGDNDGLTKSEELYYKTQLWLQDSDGDGFSDGTEVRMGYSPTIAEAKLPNGTLIKSQTKPEIYFLENKTKRHIISEQVFAQHGYRWQDIKIVSEKFLTEKLRTGEPISR